MQLEYRIHVKTTIAVSSTVCNLTRWIAAPSVPRISERRFRGGPRSRVAAPARDFNVRGFNDGRWAEASGDSVLFGQSPNSGRRRSNNYTLILPDSVVPGRAGPAPVTRTQKPKGGPGDLVSRVRRARVKLLQKNRMLEYLLNVVTVGMHALRWL